MQLYPNANFSPLTGANDPPMIECPIETEKVVPASFSDWLARPAGTITDSPELEADILMLLTSGGCGPDSNGSSANSSRAGR